MADTQKEAAHLAPPIRDDSKELDTQKEPDTPRGKTQIVVGEGGLEFVTPDGRVLAALYPQETGTLFSLQSNDGRSSITLLAAQGFTQISLRPQYGGSITVSARGTDTSVCLSSAQGDTLAAVHADATGGHFDACSPEGVSVAAMSATDTGGLVAVSSPEGQPLAGITAQEEGGMVNVFTRQGRHGVVLGTREEAGALLVYESNGAPVFSAPAWKYPAGPNATGANAEAAPTERPEGAEDNQNGDDVQDGEGEAAQ